MMPSAAVSVRHRAREAATGLIFDHLLRSYLDFGESLESAFDHAESRTGVHFTPGHLRTYMSSREQRLGGGVQGGVRRRGESVPGAPVGLGPWQPPVGMAAVADPDDEDL